MKKHSKCLQRSEPTLKRTKARGPVQRDAKEVLAEVLGKLTGKLDAPAVSTSAKENRRGNTVGPNRDRLTVGVDLGDRRSQYCILGLEGERLRSRVGVVVASKTLRNVSLRNADQLTSVNERK